MPPPEFELEVPVEPDLPYYRRTKAGRRAACDPLRPNPARLALARRDTGAGLGGLSGTGAPAAVDAQKFSRAINTNGIRLLAAARGFTLLPGPLRAVIGGGIATSADLARPYSHIVLTAFGPVLISTCLNARPPRKFNGLMADRDAFAATAPALPPATPWSDVF